MSCQYKRFDNRQNRRNIHHSDAVGMENPVDEAIKEIDAFLKVSKMKEYRLGLLACANPRAVERVRSGKASVETLRAIIDYVREHK